MEIKHKECFIPNFINHYGLQGVSKYAREAAEFVNLYSKSRGINRFPALVEQLDWLRRRSGSEIARRRRAAAQGLVDWIERESKLGNPTLEKAIAETGRRRFEKSVGVVAWPSTNRSPKWSAACRRSRTCVSAWNAQGPGRHDRLLANALRRTRGGMERARPRPIRCRDLRSGGCQQKGSVGHSQAISAEPTLMIGDAPGDYKAAVANKCLFFPINPGPRKQVGGDCTTKESPDSSKAALPEPISSNYSRSSTRSCPSGRRGRSRIEIATKNTRRYASYS